MAKAIGSKKMDKGWVDFEENPKYCQKNVLFFDNGIGRSEETNMLTSGIKSLFKKFIDVKEKYNFQGVKANPKLLAMYKNYKKNSNDKAYIGALISSYFNTLNKSIENSKDSFPFISYDLAIIDEEARIPGKLSWPKIYVFPCPVNPNFNVIRDGIYNIAKNHYKNAVNYGKNEIWINSAKKVKDSGLQPLIFDKDIVITKVPGQIVKDMANVLLQYSAKHTTDYSQYD